MARFYGLSTMGEVALALAFSTPAINFFGLAPRQVLTNGLIKDYKKYISSRIGLLLLLVVFTLAGVFFLDDDLYLIVLLVLILKLLDSFFDVRQSIYLKYSKSKKAGLSQVSRSCFIIPIFIVALCGYNAYIALLSGIAYFAIVGCDKNLFKYIIGAFYKSSYVYSLPLTIAAILSSSIVLLYSNIPRFFAANYPVELAYFVGISTLIGMLKMMLQVLLQKEISAITLKYTNTSKVWTRNLTLYAMLVIVLVFISAILYPFFGEYLLSIVYGKDFKPNSYIIYSGITYSLIISLAMIVNTFVVALKCFSSYLYYSIFILFTSLLLSFFIVPEYKATGMFIVLTCCSSLQLIFSLLIIKRKLYAKK